MTWAPVEVEISMSIDGYITGPNTDGITSTIAQAHIAAGDRKVHIMGGATVIQ